MRTTSLPGSAIVLGSLFGESRAYALPQDAANSTLRASKINATRAAFLYGEAVAGGPFYPSGDSGLAKVAVDIAAEKSEAMPQQSLVDSDVAHAAASAADVGPKIASCL